VEEKGTESVKPALEEVKELKPPKAEERVTDWKTDWEWESAATGRKDFTDDYREKTEKKLRENMIKLDEEIAQLDQTINRNFFISIGLIVVMIVVMIFIYLSLSSRIGDQEDEINRLRDQFGLVIPDNHNIQNTQITA